MSIIDEIIKNAMQKGQFANLRGQGKPLKLDDDQNVPEELRMAHRILRENDLAPEWILQGKVLDSEHERLTEVLRRAAHDYRAMRRNADESVQPEQERQHADRIWEARKKQVREQAAQYNRQVLSYNLKVPTGVTHKRSFDLDREVERYLI